MNESRLVLSIMKGTEGEQNRILQGLLKPASISHCFLGIITHIRLHIEASHIDSSSPDLPSKVLTHTLRSTCMTEKYIRLNSIKTYRITPPPHPHLQYGSLSISSVNNISFQLVCMPNTLEPPLATYSPYLPQSCHHRVLLTLIPTSFHPLHRHYYHPVWSCQRFFPGLLQ